MNAFAQHARLYSPEDGDSQDRFIGQHTEDDEGDGLEEDEEEFEDYGYDPHAELQHRRAELDNRLKNTFESIFAKYERDFEGIGDEIDLATGEIVVNNGHLIQMMDERDAGLRSEDDEIDDSEDNESLSGDGSSQESSDERQTDSDEAPDTDNDDGQELSKNEDDEEHSEDDGVETTTGDSMDDDDLILRGFTQATRYLQTSPSPDLGNFQAKTSPRHHEHNKRLSLQQKDRNGKHLDILDQFGPDLGPRIVRYISEQENAANQSRIEAAWRAPELPLDSKPLQRLSRTLSRVPDVSRSASPEASTSIWAIPGLHERRRKKRRTASSHPVRFQPFDSGVSQAGYSTEEKRNSFTEEEDEAMLEYIAKAQQLGRPLYSSLLWKQLAAQLPRHSWASWQQRYRRKYFIATEGQIPTRSAGASNFASQTRDNMPTSAPRVDMTRPSRLRKPAQKDSQIISWSEAVNTIADVDPELHAGILDDARRAKNGEQSWIFGPKHSFQTQEESPRRPVSALGYSRRERGFDTFHQHSPRRMSDSRLVTADPMTAKPVEGQHPAKQVPCPHSDCRSLSQNLYNVEAVEGRDASDLTLHLLAKHRTTPFPCEELHCLQKGGNGYLKQEDLIEHVQYAHPNEDALLRLRRRMDLILLLNKDEDASGLSHLHSSPNHHHHEATVRLKPRQLLSSRGDVSPTPRNDQTPVDLQTSHDVLSTSTPPTSFSSPGQVQPFHSYNGREIRDSQELIDSSAPVLVPSEPKIAPGSHVSKPGEHDAVPVSPETHVTLLRDGHGNDNHPLIDEDFLQPLVSTISNQTNQPRYMTFSTPPVSEASKAKVAIKSASKHLESSSPVSTPISRAPKSQNRADLQGRIKTPIAGSQKRGVEPYAKEKFARNVVPASHDFSDEEDLPVVTRAIHRSSPKEQETIAQRSVPPSSSIGKAPALPVTPSSKKPELRRGPLRRVLAEEDVDELSMSSEDLQIVSSRTRSPRPTSSGSQPEIKREGTVGPTLPSVTTSKKRKFVDLAADDDVDELGADAAFGRSTGSHVRIKKEGDYSDGQIVRGVKAQRKQAKKQYREEARKSGIELTPQSVTSVLRNTQSIRAGTPLLDLTPTRRTAVSRKRKEVQDSEEPASSFGSHLPVSAPVVVDGLLTPTKGKLGSQDHTEIPAAIVVKTPNGTFKKCGEEGFSCGRSFCFRCGKNTVVA